MSDKNTLPPFGADIPWLAPLAGFSDLPFRLLCQEQGAVVTCTEMVSAKGLVYGLQQRKNRNVDAVMQTLGCESAGAFLDTKELLETYGPVLVPSANATEDLLYTVRGEKNIVVQLFGAEPDFLHDAAAWLKELGFRWFDINMGCSVPKVNKTGAGSAMMKDMVNAAKAVEAVAKVGVVGCKFRLGWGMNERIYVDFGKAMEAAGASWVTLHPRFARQGFSGIIEQEALGSLAASVKIPVIASGDLFSAQDAVERIKNCGVSSVMFARGAMENPFIFRQYLDMVHGKAVYEPTALDLYNLVMRHALLAQAYSLQTLSRHGFPPALLKMRTVVPRYLKNFPHIKALRQRLGQCSSWKDFQEIMQEYFGAILPMQNEPRIV